MGILIKKMTYFIQRGQTLIEVMIAIGAGALILSAIVVVVISSLNNEDYGISQNQSTKFAEEGLDIMRSLAQTDWNTFVSYNSAGKYCLPKGAIFPGFNFIADGDDCPPNIDDKFIREIKIVMDSDKCNTPVSGALSQASVTSTVKWADGKCTTSTEPYCHEVSVTSCFFKPKKAAYP